MCVKRDEADPRRLLGLYLNQECRKCRNNQGGEHSEPLGVTKGLHQARETGRHVRMGVVQTMAMHGKESLSGLQFQGRRADYTPQARARQLKVPRI